MAPVKVLLLACGSFNPPTNMHLRMFEIARDNLNRIGQYSVIGGIISPVHDAYGKKDLVPATLRCEMLKLALQTSDWIRVSKWECSQEKWTTTRQVLQYHQNMLDSVLNHDSNIIQSVNDVNANLDELQYDSWLTNEIRNAKGPVQVKLLCGADFLQSFGIPGVWAESDIETIIRNYGLIVISRTGYDPQVFIYESDLLSKYRSNIIVINEWFTNDISSTKIRRALRRQESVKYLIGDSVIEFIRKQGLYGSPPDELKYTCKPNNYDSLSIPRIDDYILTPSPSDVNMRSVTSSGSNIYLELNSVENVNEDKVHGRRGKLREGSKTVPDFQHVFENGNRSPKKGKKVGLMKDAEAPETTPTEELKRSLESRKLTKLDSEGADRPKLEKSNAILRRSNSDAVMSRTNEKDEAASVKIHFTKDGIKVVGTNREKRTRGISKKKNLVKGSKIQTRRSNARSGNKTAAATG